MALGVMFSKVDFDPRLRLEFHGAKVTSDAGLMSSALLVINEIPDVGPDRATGKMHLVARFGAPCGAWGYLLGGSMAD